MLGKGEHYSSSVKCEFTTGTKEQEKDGSIQEAKLGVAEFCLLWSGMMCRSLRFTLLTPLSSLSATHLSNLSAHPGWLACACCDTNQ